MKVSSSAIILAAALGVSAHPSVHGHQHAHRSLEAREQFVKNVQPSTVPSSAPAVPSPTASTLPSPSSVSQGSGASGYVPFCSGSSNSKRATAAEIASVGNLGSPDDYGCNLMTIAQSAIDLYSYTLDFENAGSGEQDCKCWNKIGPDGGINGFFSSNLQTLNFTLAGGASQAVAIESNSQGACACQAPTLQVTSFGEFASTWIEFDFNSTVNGGWSGVDASCLVAVSADLDIPGVSVCMGSECSVILPGGQGTNAYVAGTADLDGIGLNIVPGPAHLSVTVG